MPVPPTVDVQSQLPAPTRLPAPSPAIVVRAPTEIERRRRQFDVLRQQVGTGGTIEGFAGIFLGTTNAVFVVLDKRGETTQGPAVPEMVRTIKASLTPQIKDMAVILGVRRPTIYAWLDGSSVPVDDNLARIKEVYALAQGAATLFEGLDQKLLHTALLGSPLVSLLQRASIPHAQVQTQLRAVKRQVQESMAQRARRKQVDLMGIARQMGKPARPDPEARLQIDILTGRGYSPEAEQG